mgnify:CR=1 FL=1
MNDGAALVLFSGGQDSSVCLAWALDRYAHVETIGFDYGQRHKSELAARPRILEKLRTDFPDWTGRLGQDHLLPLDILKAIGGSALTDDTRRPQRNHQAEQHRQQGSDEAGSDLHGGAPGQHEPRRRATQ